MSPDSLWLRCYTIGLQLLFVINIINLIRIDGFDTDYFYQALWLHMAMGALQGSHALWVGYGLGSSWYKQYAKAIGIYLLVVFGVITVALMLQTLILIIVLLVVLGLIFPTAMAGFYAFAQAGFTKQSQAPQEPNPNILDDL